MKIVLFGKEAFNMTPQEAKEIVDKIQIQLDIPAKTPTYEKDLFQKFASGLSKGSLDNIYTFIDALERGNKIISASDLQFTLSFLYNEHPKILLHHFLNEAEFLRICFLFRSCKPEIIKYIALNTSDNGLLIYEALRQIYLHTSNYASKLSDIVEIMNHLAEKDVEKLIYFINKNHYSLSKEPFFSTLLEYASETLLTILFANIDIGHIDNRIDFGKCITEQNEKSQTTFITKICPIIIAKWYEHCEKQKKNATILSALHITQYFSLICISFEQTYNFKEIERLLEDALNIFHSDLHHWYETSSKFLVYYFLNLTQIYILLNIVKNNNYTFTDELKTKLKIFKNTLLKNKSLWLYGTTKQLDVLISLIP